MSSKEELAALMSSDGDFEKKISLLKKAVVTVTKQKLEAEARQTKLQGELSAATQQLAEAQQANAALQRKVKSLEAQLEQDRSSGSAFGHNMLKGLSSIMGNSDNSSRGGQGGRGSASAHLTLSPEDVERLISENEQLHRQTYSFKTKLEDAQRSSARDAEKLKSELARLHREAQELHRSLETTTATCDGLRSDYLTERALGDFCRHFFVAALRRTGQEQESSVAGTTVEVRWPANAPPSHTAAASLSDTPPAEWRERVVLTLKGAACTLTTLLRSISVLAVVLREQLPSRERATVGDLECLRDRLSIFLEAHTVKKDRLLHLVEQLHLHLSAPPDVVGDGSPTSVSVDAVVEAQDEILQLVLEWVSLLRTQFPLLVESCVSFQLKEHANTIETAQVSADNGEGTAAPPKAATARRAFVMELTEHGCATLASIEGSLRAMRILVQRSPAAYGHCRNDGDQRSEASTSTAARERLALNLPLEATQLPIDVSSLLALQQFWWEGCMSVRSLHGSVQVLNRRLVDMAETCNKSEIRDALHCVCKCLQSMTPASPLMDAPLGAVAVDADAVVHAGSPCASTPPMPSPATSRVSPSWMSRPSDAVATGSLSPAADSVHDSVQADNFEELLAALSAADRAAASYYTQMNCLYVEMAEKEDALQTALDAVAHLQRLIKAERADAKQTRQALQSQIGLLSTKLVEMADAPADSVSQ
ncbi:hypothetical protein LSCM1_04513 [Leishmania martiniquensis]|uniref:Uncharacterized protein n=1 Tax=Leishmania martiniquensis TaxID=1580590 RepID=A0A836HBW7_9TRYP|nr:hypothetical protein LSCM1_04513 [Leishmania martiniquensis]